MLAIECGTCRSGRTGAARLEVLGWRRCLEPSRGEAGLRGEKAALDYRANVLAGMTILLVILCLIIVVGISDINQFAKAPSP